MSDALKVTYELLGPGSFDHDAKDWRDDYVIQRVETTTTTVGRFASREEAREFMIATADQRARTEVRSPP